MGVLAHDDDFYWDKSAADKVTILPIDWKLTAREISQTAVARYHGNTQFTDRKVAAKILPLQFSPRVETVALCAVCASEPRFSSSSCCAECLARQMRRDQLPVIKLTERQMLWAWLVVGFLIAVFFLSALAND